MVVVGYYVLLTGVSKLGPLVRFREGVRHFFCYPLLSFRTVTEATATPPSLQIGSYMLDSHYGL